MGLDLWFHDDITRILAAALETMRRTQDAAALATPASDEYRQGFEDAARVIGIAFGIGIDCERGDSRRQPEQLAGGGCTYLR